LLISPVFPQNCDGKQSCPVKLSDIALPPPAKKNCLPAIPCRARDYAMSDTPPPTSPKTIPAATVVIFRNAADNGAPELLMVQRSREMRFAGGAAVFPGGKIDPADYELATRIAPNACLNDTAARIAAMRETLEETGLVIAITHPVSANEAAAARAHLLEQGALAPVPRLAR